MTGVPDSQLREKHVFLLDIALSKVGGLNRLSIDQEVPCQVKIFLTGNLPGQSVEEGCLSRS